MNPYIYDNNKDTCIPGFILIKIDIETQNFREFKAGIKFAFLICKISDKKYIAKLTNPLSTIYRISVLAVWL